MKRKLNRVNCVHTAGAERNNYRKSDADQYNKYRGDTV